MSTRRARIKAVAALPPRRKNADIDGNKNKQVQHKDGFEKGPKSPLTPRPLVANETGKNSPVAKNIRTPPALLPIAVKTPIATENVPSPNKTVTPTEPLLSKPKQSEKVEVISSTGSLVSSAIFASPLVKGNADSRNVISSPLIPPSPKCVKKDSPHPSTLLIDKLVIDVSGKEAPNASGDAPKKNDNIPDDYSVPSVPESVTDDVMDGIVPLQPVTTAPKPIDLLKNEIISENAQVLFDPIVPLPSPSKARLKLRPVPRLAPHRRNSIQGSASESEDESRRALANSTAPPPPPRQRHDSHTSHSTLQSVPHRELNRTRNDSVCSSISQTVPQPPPATSPIKEKHLSKARRQEMSRRMWRRRRETVKRDALTMYDLIFYNPTTNPIIPDQDELNAKEENAKEEAERKAKAESEEDPDDPEPAAESAPVPQIKLGPNGEIMLDEKSLVIKQSDDRKVQSVVREGAWASGSGGKYSRSARTAEWSQAETVRFYRALAAIGTDFSLMAPLFPDRSRKDLKLKFKKEEKLNGAQVDKALRSGTSWDVERLLEEFQEERAEAARQAEIERTRLIENKRAERERLRVSRELRVRPSRGAKALESTVDATAQNPEMTADDFIQRHLEAKQFERDRKKRKPRNRTPDLIPIINMPTMVPAETPQSQFATLTLLGRNAAAQQQKSNGDVVTISRVEPKMPQNLSSVPSNIETGSLVVLRVTDPSSPTKTMLQTYIAHGAGKLTPVALPSTLLNSVVGYMKKGTPKSTISTGSSPQLTSPSSVASQDSRSCNTPSVIQITPSPAKRQRHSSYTIQQL